MLLWPTIALIIARLSLSMFYYGIFVDRSAEAVAMAILAPIMAAVVILWVSMFVAPVGAVLFGRPIVKIWAFQLTVLVIAGLAVAIYFAPYLTMIVCAVICVIGKEVEKRRRASADSGA